MHLAPAFEEVTGCPNHGRAISVFFGRIKISLDDIYPQNRDALRESASFEYIEKSLNGTPDKLFVKINHFGSTSREQLKAAKQSTQTCVLKKRKLEEELTKSQNKISLLEKDLSTSREQLKAAKQSTQTCVLSLKSNPTLDFETIKRSILKALKKENEELLASYSESRSILLIDQWTLGAHTTRILGHSA
ncbi:hypothetical protein FAUST_3593 [Fusarium austroamericanum]|uniref:Uncharacterized protein n=1 Tax=Fusarium austroamericanum TaxID=282268 RepID=A0AAN6HHN9_FUSAU|nr:hypothetical protein FAUST_3593 [Fusarium austroamericanum]